MTYIKRMEFYGFKSFANKTVIDIPKGFNVFVGSNGSGKSNIIDAICFVLGKRSKKSMRAEMLTDLIFNGGKKGRPAKYAEVSIVFDNSSGIFPIDKKEVVITRRVLKKGVSIYRINGTLAKREEVLNLLSRAAINPDGFNIILQGDIQKFINLSPEERRLIIEDVSEISIYEEKKKKSLRELDKVDDKLKEAKITLVEKEKYLKELINDKRQAEKYLKLKDELFDKKALLLFKRIHNLEQKRTLLEEEISKYSSLEKEYEREISSLRERISNIEKEEARVREELMLKGDEEQKELSRRIDKVNARKIELENLIQNHKNELLRIKNRIINVKKELVDVESQIKQTNKELAELKKKISAVKSELLEKKKSTLEIEEINKLKSKLINIEERISRVKEKLIITEKSRETLSEINNYKSKLSELQFDYKKLLTELSEKELKRSQLYNKRSEITSYLSHLEKEKLRIEAKKESLISSSSSVRKILDMPGVYGTIGSLGVIDKRYALALSVAAGRRVNAVVVDTDITAQRCIEYLRANKLGTATFIPLNKINPKITLRKISLPGVIDYAINLVKFDSKFRKAFELILGDTLVVKDLNVARAIPNMRIVTLDGDLVERSGIMTGGYRGKSIGFMVEDLNKKLDDVIHNKNKYSKYLSEISESIAILDEEILSLREEKARIEARMSELENAIDSLKSKVEDVGDVVKLTEELNSLLEEKNKVKEKLQKCADERVISVAKEEVRKLEDAYNKLLIEEGTKKSKLEQILLKEKEKLIKIINELKSEQESFREELENAKKEYSNVKLELANLRKEESRFYKALKELYDKRDALQKERDMLLKKINDLEKKIYSVKEKSQSITIKRAEILAKLEGLKTAFKEFENWEPRLSKKSEDELRSEIAKLEVEIKNFGPVNMKSLETYKEVEVEYNELKEKVDGLNKEKQEILSVIDEIEKRKIKAFKETFNKINETFGRIYSELSPGGVAKMIIDNPENPFEGGISVIVMPKGKRVSSLRSISGGEKTMAALAFIFAIQESYPTPFYIMDEVDAALDKYNAEKLAQLIKKYSQSAQFLIISHNDEVISAGDNIYGITMDDRGISKIVSIRLPEE